MPARKSPFFVTTIALSLLAFLAMSSSGATAKSSSPPAKSTKQTKKKKKKKRRARRKSLKSRGLVPPPPPYAPSILPELMMKRPKTVAQPPVEKVEEEDNPQLQYIYSTDGYESPKPEKKNKYVTNWNQS